MKNIKKIVIILSVLILLISSSFASFLNNNEIIDTSHITTTDKIKNNFYNGEKILLKGKIIKQMSYDKYIFEDYTGTTIISIKPEKLPLNDFSSDHVVKIYGKIKSKKKLQRIEIIVDRIEILQI